MSMVNLSDIYDLISNLSREETQNYNDYMRNNPQDTQRTHDHILIQSIYGKILYQLEMMTDYSKLKEWMERKFGASPKTTIMYNGKTYTGHIFGNDDCYDGNEFFQYFLTEDALLKLYYHIPDGCTDFNAIDYSAPYKILADDAQYWIDYVI